MSDSDTPDSPASNGKAASPVLSPASPPSAAVAPILRRPAGAKLRRPPTQLLQAQRESAASSAGSADEQPPSGRESAGPAVLRRPVGPKSRRPPMQLLQSQRDTAGSSVTSVDELSAQQEAADAAADPKPEAEADNASFSGPDLSCDPVAEVQDEDEPAPSAPSRPWQLPCGAVPMLPGFGGGIGLLKPRVPRQRPAAASAADSDATADSTNSAAARATAADADADAEPSKPLIRLRPAGAGPLLPPPPSVAATDLLALRQQLRKTTVSPKLFSGSPPQSPPEPLLPAPPPTQSPPKPSPQAPPPPQSPPKPSTRVPASPAQSPPPLSSLPRLPSDCDGAEKKLPPPRPPPPVVKPKPQAVKDDGSKAATPE